MIDGLLDVLNAAGVKVFWVSIPPMGDAKYDADMQTWQPCKSRKSKQRSDLCGFAFGFLTPDGAYTDKAPTTPASAKIAFKGWRYIFQQGNNRFGQLLLAEIKRVIAASHLKQRPSLHRQLPPRLPPSLRSHVRAGKRGRTPSHSSPMAR